jgi:signal transduction histidine kinase
VQPATRCDRQTSSLRPFSGASRGQRRPLYIRDNIDCDGGVGRGVFWRKRLQSGWLAIPAKVILLSALPVILLAVFRRGLITIFCFFLVALIGWLDYVTGFENSLLTFYLGPIAIGTWFLGIWFGIAIAVFCVIATIVSDLAAGLPRIAIWNCGSAFIAYLIFVYLLRRYQSLLNEMHLRVKERTADLQRELARRQQLEKEIAMIAEQERSRVGRELHDSLGQHLTGTGLLAETIATQLEKENNAIRPTARKVVKLIDQGIDLTREIARCLYSSELDGDGLFSALESLSRSVGNDQVRCEFEHSGKPPRSKELTTHVLLGGARARDQRA